MFDFLQKVLEYAVKIAFGGKTIGNPHYSGEKLEKQQGGKIDNGQSGEFENLPH